MSHFCGWLGRTTKDGETPAPPRMSQSLHPLPALSLRHDKAVFCVDESAFATADRAQSGMITILGQLSSPYRYLENPLDALMRQYKRQGPAFLQHCEGEFALALSFPESDTLLLATDRLGSYPLHYHASSDGIVFSTAPLSLSLRVPQVLWHYLALNCIPPYTAWPALEPGEYLLYRDGQTFVRPYTRHRQHGRAPEGFQHQRKQQFKRLLHRSIERYRPLPHHALYHGGDTASAYLLKQLQSAGIPPKTSVYVPEFEGAPKLLEKLTLAHPGQSVDWQPVPITAEHFCREMTTLFKQIAEPIGYLPALSHYVVARAAYESGTNLLLTAEGAKTAFVHSSRYAKHVNWSVPHWVQRWFHRQPAPKTYGFDKALETIRDEHWSHQEDLSEWFTPDFRQRIRPDEPFDILRLQYDKSVAQTDHGKLNALSLCYRLTHCQLRQLRHVASAAQLDMTFPYLYDPLIQFSNSLPDHWKSNHPNHPAFFLRWTSKAFPTLPHQGVAPPLLHWLEQSADFQSFCEQHLQTLVDHDVLQPGAPRRLLEGQLAGPVEHQAGWLWLFLSAGLWLSAQQRPTERSSPSREKGVWVES